MNQTLPHPPPQLANSIRLAAVPTAVGCARAFVRQSFRQWHLPEPIDTVELIVSELITNAVIATGVLDPNPDNFALAGVAFVVLRLSVVDAALRIEVWDDSPKLPTLQPQQLEVESGRGMLLVDAMTGSRWGAIPAPDGSGKVVWADVVLEPEMVSAPPAPTPLPKRRRTSPPAVVVHQAAMVDIALLERVLLGLKRLNVSASAGVASLDESLFSD